MTRPPRSIWSPFDGHWETALTAAEWQARFSGPLPPTCAAWLKPGPRATFVPCIHADGCGQPHRVHRLGDRKTWLALPVASDCENFPLTDATVATHQLDLDSLVHAIAHALRLDSVALEHLQRRPALLRLGHTGRNHLPCFFSVASSPIEVARVVSSLALIHPGMLLLFVPLVRHIPTAIRTTLRARGGLLALDEVLDLDARGQLIAIKPLADLLPSVAIAKPAAVPRLIVPAGTPWRDIHLKIINGKTLIATHGSRTAEASAEQLGQVPRDDPDNFRPGWRTLVAFAAKHVLTGDEPGLFPNASDFKNRRADVRAILRNFISISANPIRDLSKRPKDADSPVRKGDRAQRKLRRGFDLIPPIELIKGVDKRIGHLADVSVEDPAAADTADSYPHRSQENSDEL